MFEEVPSVSGPLLGFGIFVHIWVPGHQSASLLLVPSQHFSKQQPSSPSGELPPLPQETPSVQAPLPRSAPPGGSAMETGKGSCDVLPHRKPQKAGSVIHCLFWGEKCKGKTSLDSGFVWYSLGNRLIKISPHYDQRLKTFSVLNTFKNVKPSGCQTSEQYHTSMPGLLAL